jgi:hypothetical protein
MGCVDGDEKIAEVNYRVDIIPAIVSFYQNNPLKWVRDGLARYIRFTDFGELRVERVQTGEWEAFRAGFPLRHHGQRARFWTMEEAQQIADAHKAEGFPNAEILFDSFAWEPDPDPWWTYAHMIATLRPQFISRL